MRQGDGEPVRALHLRHQLLANVIRPAYSLEATPERGVDLRIVGPSRSGRYPAEVQIRLRRPAPMDDVWDRYVEPVDVLIQVCAGRPGGWSGVDVTPLRATIGEAPLHRSVAQPGARRPPTRWRRPFLRLDALGGDFPDVLERWLDLYERYRIPIDELLAGWAEPKPDQRARRLAVAVEGLSELAADHLDAPMSDDEWAELRRILHREGLGNDLVVKIEQAIFRPTFADQLNAVVAHLGGDRIPEVARLADEIGRVKKVRNSFSHAEAHQHRPGEHDAVTAAAVAESFALALLARQLVTDAVQADALVVRAIRGPGSSG
ncbi:MAG: hypothetical protein OEY23_04295 [Acidimicrobiia bacterium]|nr:hypothetical protein [Acidimicrobiia bacterium]